MTVNVLLTALWQNWKKSDFVKRIYAAIYIKWIQDIFYSCFYRLVCRRKHFASPGCFIFRNKTLFNMFQG